MLKRVIGVGACLALAPGVAIAQRAEASARPGEGDVLVRVGDATLTPLTPDDIPLASAPTMAWAMEPGGKVVRSGSPLNRVLLVRLDPDTLGADTRARAAGGVVAYSAFCTHEGCEVSGWVSAEQMLFCACHQSTFDPRNAARVVDGPAPRSLPALPLKTVDATLVVARPFTSRVGSETP